MTGCPPAKFELFASTDAAFIAQNVYLFCASEGLGCVVRASLDHKVIAKTLRLGPKQIVALAQTVGYAKQP
jgi:nitroreductase